MKSHTTVGPGKDMQLEASDSQKHKGKSDEDAQTKPEPSVKIRFFFILHNLRRYFWLDSDSVPHTFGSYYFGIRSSVELSISIFPGSSYFKYCFDT